MQTLIFNLIRSRFPRAAMACALCLGCAPVISAQEAPPKPPAAGRYLLAFDISRSMRTRSGSVQTNLMGLLARDMNRNLRPGDTIGVWTYNEAVYAGQFPLQVWSPQASYQIFNDLNNFLKKQRYQKKSRFDVLWKELLPLIKDSRELTVVLFTSGEEKISGTPDDARINSFFDDKRFEQKNSPSLLFIVVLRTKNGNYLGGDVAMSAEQLKFPPFPPEPKAPESKPALSASSPAPSKVPPFVMQGSKVISAPRPRLFETPATNSVTNVPQIQTVSNTTPETVSQPPATPAPPDNVDTNLAANPTPVPEVAAPSPATNQPSTPDSASAGADQPTNAPPSPASSGPIPSKKISTGTRLLIAGFVLTGVAVGLIIFRHERSHSNPSQRIKISN